MYMFIQRIEKRSENQRNRTKGLWNMTEALPAEEIQVSLKTDNSVSAVYYGTRFEFLPNGDLEIYSRQPVQVKPASEASADEKLSDSEIEFGKPFVKWFFIMDVKDVRVQETSKHFVVYTDRPVNVKHDIDPKARIIGEVAEEKNGYAYVGTLPDGRDVYAAPEDLAGTMSQRKAARAIKKLNKQQGSNAHLPDEAELTLVFKAKAALAGLNQSGIGNDAGLYWTSERKGMWGTDINMKYGSAYQEGRRNKRSVRPVQN